MPGDDRQHHLPGEFLGLEVVEAHEPFLDVGVDEHRREWRGDDVVHGVLGLDPKDDLVALQVDHIDDRIVRIGDEHQPLGIGDILGEHRRRVDRQRDQQRPDQVSHGGHSSQLNPRYG